LAWGDLGDSKWLREEIDWKKMGWGILIVLSVRGMLRMEVCDFKKAGAN
jgi:hypothetical protein